jgi:hypothetical protein
MFDLKKYSDNLNNMVEIKSCDTFDCIFKALKKPYNDKNLFIDKLSLDFRLNIFKNLNLSKQTFKHNLNNNDLKKIYEYSKTKPFKIAECDKNIGAVIIPNNLYKELALESLSNTKLYKKLDYNPLEETLNKINNILSFLTEKNYISKYLFNKI